MSSLTRQIRKNRARLGKPKATRAMAAIKVPTERLFACAIVRDGRRHSYGFRSHAEIRRKLGDEDPYNSTPGDEEGFITTEDRFLSRRAAMILGEQTGQCQAMVRDLLSSDINWEAWP